MQQLQVTGLGVCFSLGCVKVACKSIKPLEIGEPCGALYGQLLVLCHAQYHTGWSTQKGMSTLQGPGM